MNIYYGIIWDKILIYTETNGHMQSCLICTYTPDIMEKKLSNKYGIHKHVRCVASIAI